jgi:26S proteasome regulatory subunit N2
MTEDPVDFVRQGALIALGMILIQQSEAATPASSTTRALYTKIIGDKHEDHMARFGAALGQGLIDVGGRNVSISLQSRAGSQNMNAIIGMVFCQFWYWYPLAHCMLWRLSQPQSSALTRISRYLLYFALFSG